MRTTRRLSTALAVLITALLWGAPALARSTTTRTQTASAPIAGGGRVSATLTFTPRSYYDAGLHLTIHRAGQQLYSAAVRSSPCGTTCSVASAKAVAVTALEPNGEPVVRVDLYTGGAHCCYTTQFYTYHPGTRTYSEYDHDWGDPGYALKQLGGRYVFESADDRFAYEFTDYAASGMPLELFSYDGTKLIEVTDHYPKLIAADAARYLRAFNAEAKQRYADSVGIIAAWAADEDELGDRSRVTRFLAAQAADGHLNSGIPGMAEGARFVTNLDAFLHRTGYLE